MLNHLIGLIGSSALDEKMLTEPNVAATVHTFSSLSLESLKNVYASVEGNEALKYVSANAVIELKNSTYQHFIFLELS